MRFTSSSSNEAVLNYRRVEFRPIIGVPVGVHYGQPDRIVWAEMVFTIIRHGALASPKAKSVQKLPSFRRGLAEKR